MNMYCLEEKLNAGEVGNKAAFLSLMKRNGFNVPTGIVLGNDIFTKTISANDNKHEVDMLLEVLSKSNAKETSDKISELYSSLKLHDEVKSEIEENSISDLFLMFIVLTECFALLSDRLK